MDGASGGAVSEASTNEDVYSPESSEEASSSSDEQSEGQPGRRKRKLETHDEDADRRKRRQAPAVNKEYIWLLNETIAEAAGTRQSPVRPSESSEHGSTLWLGSEKDEVYDSLAHCRAKGLLRRNGSLLSKSDVDVLQFHGDLKQQSDHHWANAKSSQLLKTSDIPSAFEINDTCCHALEDSADAVAFWQYETDLQHEEVRFPGRSLLTQATASKLESEVLSLEPLKSDDDGDHNIPQSVDEDPLSDAIGLLKVSRMLGLSRDIFMNTTSPPNTCTTAAEAMNEDEPAMFASAFVCLHNLVVGITRRLLDTTLIQAESRMKALDFRRRPTKRYVKARDVITATRVLNMREDSVRFWQTAPRRLGLKVYRAAERSRTRTKTAQESSQNGESSALGYDELETILGAPAMYTDDDGKISPRSTENAFGTSNIETSSSEASRASSEELSNQDIDIEDTPHGYLPSQCKQEIRAHAEMEEEYLEAIDKCRNLAEEKRLQSLVPQLQRHHKEPETIEAPIEPAPRRKTVEELADWRDVLNMRSEWESYGAASIPLTSARTSTAAPFEEFQLQRGRPRRISSEDSAWGLEPSSTAASSPHSSSYNGHESQDGR